MDDGAVRGAHRTRETKFSERKIKIDNNIDNNSIKHIYNIYSKKKKKTNYTKKMRETNTVSNFKIIKKIARNSNKKRGE